MTKTIHIIRHAKSDWSNECLDYDRGLNQRGYNDAKSIAVYLLEKKYRIEHIFCSSANRAKLTLQELNRILCIKTKAIDYIDDLYLASRGRLVNFIEQIDDCYEHVAIVAHNPGLTELCNYLTGDYLSNLPTCSVYTVQFNVDTWQAIGADSGSMQNFITPKQLKSNTC